MFKFLMGVVVGILIFFLFFYFGGGKIVRKAGEGLIHTGKEMEAMQDVLRKEKSDNEKGMEKKINKEERKAQPKKMEAPR
jgi:hypothetical protein